MTQTFDFFYDFGSPYTFLVHKLLPDIEARTGATAIYKPMLLGILLWVTVATVVLAYIQFNPS